MEALLDLDIFIYRSAAASENEDLDIAVARINDSIQWCLDRVGATTYRGFISGENNFRMKVNPDYKGNRKDMVEPRWRQDLKEHCILNWSGEVTHEIEADDALGIAQHEGSIIVSLDKDLRQIPGRHYSFEISGKGPTGTPWVRPEEFVTVEPLDGLRFFYKQLLIGDKADNIFGVDRVGPVKAGKYLDHVNVEEEMFNIVKDLYNDDKRMLMNARCLYIWQKPEDDWLDSEWGQILNAAVVSRNE